LYIPQYVAQSLAKAALASSIASVAANNILIVSSYGSGSGLDAVGLIIYVTRIRRQAKIGAPAGLPWPAAARPPLRQGPRRATAKPAGSASAPGRYAST